MRDFSILSAVVDDLKDIQTCADTVTTVPDCTICQQTEKKNGSAVVTCCFR